MSEFYSATYVFTVVDLIFLTTLNNSLTHSRQLKFQSEIVLFFSKANWQLQRLCFSRTISYFFETVVQCDIFCWKKSCCISSFSRIDAHLLFCFLNTNRKNIANVEVVFAHFCAHTSKLLASTNEPR